MKFATKKLFAFPLAFGVAGGALLLGASPASADDVGVVGYRASGHVWNSHRDVNACDRVSDGWGVRTYYTLRSGATGVVDNRNGAGTCLPRYGAGSLSNPIVRITVCAGNNGANSVCYGPVNV